MKVLLLLFVSFCVVTACYGDQRVAYTGMTPEQNQEFEDQIDAALIKEHLKIEKLQEKIDQQKKRLPPSVQLELTKAKLNLEVKSTLVKNYLRTSILQSEKVREELLQLLNKPSVSLEDLIALQKLVNHEKKKMMQ